MHYGCKIVYRHELDINLLKDFFKYTFVKRFINKIL